MEMKGNRRSKRMSKEEGKREGWMDGGRVRLPHVLEGDSVNDIEDDLQ